MKSQPRHRSLNVVYLVIPLLLGLALRTNVRADDDESSEDDAPKPALKAKRVAAPANLRFDRKRVKHAEKDLELDGEEKDPGAKPDIKSASAEIPPATQEAMSKAETYARASKWKETIDTLKPVTQSLPREGLLILSKAYGMLRLTNDEFRVLDLAKNKYPTDPVILTRLGQTYSKLKKTAEASQAFYDARESDANYKPAAEGLLNELQLQGNFYEARTLAEDMIAKFGDDPIYHTALCRLLTKDAFLDKAVDTCQTATQKAPGIAENYVNLAVALRDKQELTKAVAAITEAAAKFPKSDAVLNTQGLLFADRKDFEGAYGAYKRATSVAAKSLPAWIGFGRASFDLHKYQESLDAFKQACRLDSHSLRDFREMTGRLHKDKNSAWESKFSDALSFCTNGV